MIAADLERISNRFVAIVQAAGGEVRRKGNLVVADGKLDFNGWDIRGLSFGDLDFCCRIACARVDTAKLLRPTFTLKHPFSP